MEQLRFDGRTAIVTGAGGNPGLGRSYAMLLAERGANVVVNDIGHVPEVPMYEGSADPAQVVAEIEAAGGKAVADTSDISTEEGANALVAKAIDAFGSVDIVVNNAVLCIMARFDAFSSRHIRRIIDTDLMGPLWLSRAAFPHMKAAGYGRVVNIGAAVFGGNLLMSAYGVSKGGLFMLSQALNVEGREFGIKANTVNPIGYSRMVPALQQEGSPIAGYIESNFPPDITAPLVAYLAHESCPVSGECFDTAGGKVSRTVVARNDGFTDPAHTIEQIAQRWDEVMSTDDLTVIEAIGLAADESGVRPYSEYAAK
ncbi:MAG: SDR family NAD(P)-dependent oxidoreductase [Novosphingobium sp.]|nr:SDR family NAD(P)-dependent oxidoreductase [Novosphingobium sp.]